MRSVSTPRRTTYSCAVELAYDGQDFLAAKFRIGRQIITDYAVPNSDTQRLLTKPLKVLLVVDPTATLPQAEIEAHQLQLLLQGIDGIALTQLNGTAIRKVPLLSALQNHDVVHFAGHSYYDADSPTKSGWRLAEDVLTAGEISKLSTPPLLVFSNSCQAGITAEWDGPRYEGQAFGIGSAFLLAGVKNYIGTFWVVHDDESARFAAQYYQGVAQGHSLGTALQQARHTALAQGRRAEFDLGQLYAVRRPSVSTSVAGGRYCELGRFRYCNAEPGAPNTSESIDSSCPVFGDAFSVSTASTRGFR